MVSSLTIPVSSCIARKGNTISTFVAVCDKAQVRYMQENKMSYLRSGLMNSCERCVKME